MALKTTYDGNAKIWCGQEHSRNDPTVSFGQLLLDRLAMHGTKLMQLNHETGYEMNAHEMRMKSIRIAASLATQGIGPGDIVQTILSEHDDYVPLWLGIIAAGAGMHALHAGFNEQEISHFVGLVQPKMIVCEEHLVPIVRKILRKTNVTDAAATIVCTFQKSCHFISVHSLLLGWDDESFKYELPTLGNLNESVALVLCTSGTTGLPKAVQISHMMAKLNFCKKRPCHEGMRVFCEFSLYWVSCSITVVLTIMQRLVRVITTEPKVTPDYCLQMVQQQRIHMLFTGTVNIKPLAECIRSGKYDISSLQVVQTTGSHVSAATRAFFQEQYKGLTLYIYGMSDVGGGIAISNNLKSSGQLMPGVCVKIVDMESGRQLGPNESGELWLKTVVPMMGYLRPSTADDAFTVNDGWFRTGDLGYFDDDGELFLVGRQKDIIKTCGYTVSPMEVEATIQKYFPVEDVVVVGIPDAREDVLYWPAAVVVRDKENLSISEEDIIKCVEDNMMDWKWLRGGVYFVDKIPRTVTGKFLRNEVQKMANTMFLSKKHGGRHKAIIETV